MNNITIKCTEDQYNTIYTALRLEYLKNYNQGTEAEEQLKEALEVVRAANGLKELRVSTI